MPEHVFDKKNKKTIWTVGVLQGSVLGPTLFNFYFNSSYKYMSTNDTNMYLCWDSFEKYCGNTTLLVKLQVQQLNEKQSWVVKKKEINKNKGCSN